MTSGPAPSPTGPRTPNSGSRSPRQLPGQWRSLCGLWLWLWLALLAIGCASTGVTDPGARRASGTLEPVHPPLLRPGSVIRFVAPAGRLDRARMTLAKQRLEAHGYVVELSEQIYSEHGYLAGTDQRRADELMDAFRDPRVDAIFPGTGGYGTMRILDRLDYQVIRANPKLLIGFSDITGLHAALGAKAGLVTYHSPNPMWGLGSPDGMTSFTEWSFFRALDAARADRGYLIEAPPGVPQPMGLTCGRARGRLVGGNLSLVAALEGTPYAVDMDEAILLIEDVHEAPYRVDRMLRQLELAGRFERLRGVVLGQFTDNYEPGEPIPAPTFQPEGVLEQYFGQRGIPVLVNFPLGHHPMNATLPLGAEVEIDADAGLLRVLPRAADGSGAPR